MSFRMNDISMLAFAHFIFSNIIYVFHRFNTYIYNYQKVWKVAFFFIFLIILITGTLISLNWLFFLKMFLRVFKISVNQK